MTTHLIPPIISSDASASIIGIGEGLAHPISRNQLGTYSGSPIIVMYSGADPYGTGTPGMGFQLHSGKSTSSSSYLDFNTLTGDLRLKGTLLLGEGASDLTIWSGAGMYVDPQGRFRVGNDTTGSDYLIYIPEGHASYNPNLNYSHGMLISASQFTLSVGTSSLYITSQNSGVIKLGTVANPGGTLKSGSGVYIDGQYDGQFRVGDFESGSYMMWSGSSHNGALYISGAVYYNGEWQEITNAMTAISNDATASLSSSNAVQYYNLSASVASISTSFAFENAALSASVTGQSSSMAQQIEDRAVTDAFNMIKLPHFNPTPITSGLILDDEVMGFYKYTIAGAETPQNFPVIISASGDFRFADVNSWNSTTSQHDNYVGFVNGNFGVQSERLRLKTAGLYILGTSGISSSNVIKLGANVDGMTFTRGKGFYVDGAGNLRVGTDTTGSNFLLFDNEQQALLISASKFELIGGTTVAISSTANSGTIALGANASQMTLTNGDGVFIAGGYHPYSDPPGTIVPGGIFRVGKAQGERIVFAPEIGLLISSSTLILKAGSPTPTLVLTTDSNQGKIALGTNADSMVLLSGAGFYADGNAGGRFRVGNPSGHFLAWYDDTIWINGAINYNGVWKNITDVISTERDITDSSIADTYRYVDINTSASMAAVSTSIAFERLVNESVVSDASSQLGQQIEDRAVTDTFHKIKLPHLDPAPSRSGLYLDDEVMGFYSWSAGAQGTKNYPVILSASGEFLFSDVTEPWSGPNPDYYVGFVGGNFGVQSKRLRLSTYGLYILGSSDLEPSGSVIKLGANAISMSLLRGAGVYSDGVGNFRTGTDITGSNWMMFDNGAAQALLISSSHFELIGGSTLAISSTSNSGTIALGANAPSMTLTNGVGVFMCGSGSTGTGAFRVGNPAGDQILFDGGNGLIISASKFSMQVGNPVTLKITDTGSGSIALGTGAAGMNINNYHGTFMDGYGNFGVGNYDGAKLEFSSSQLLVSSSNFQLTGASMSLDSFVSGGLLRMGEIGPGTDFNTGNGIWMDGMGFFRAGNVASGTYIKFRPPTIVDPVGGFSVSNLDILASSLTGDANISSSLSTFEGKSVSAIDLIDSSKLLTIGGDGSKKSIVKHPWSSPAAPSNTGTLLVYSGSSSQSVFEIGSRTILSSSGGGGGTYTEHNVNFTNGSSIGSLVGNTPAGFSETIVTDLTQFTLGMKQKLTEVLFGTTIAGNGGWQIVEANAVDPRYWLSVTAYMSSSWDAWSTPNSSSIAQIYGPYELYINSAGDYSHTYAYTFDIPPGVPTPTYGDTLSMKLITHYSASSAAVI